MKYPVVSNNQSQALATTRLNRAVAALGEEVVRRIVAFGLFLIGFPRQYVAQSLGFSTAGLKSLVDQVLKDGLARFVDRRKKQPYPSIARVESAKPAKPHVEIGFEEGLVNVKLSDPCELTVQQGDRLGRKLLAMILIDSGLISQRKGAELIGCQALAVSKNFQLYRQEGSRGLVDRRVGQRREYKFTPSIKGELIYAFTMDILKQCRTSQGTITSHLEKAFNRPFSTRSVSYHLARGGLNDIKKRLISDIMSEVNDRVEKKRFMHRRSSVSQP
jgi:hypothetical protein